MATAAQAQSISDEYASAAPFPHIVLDGYFPAARIGQVAREVAALDIPAEPDFYGSNRKRKLSDRSRFGTATGALVDELNSPGFISWLEELTGIGGLVADPLLEGGGIHRIERGGFLKIHSDFNWNARLQLHRRVNLLLYLNEDWQDAWNGHLELWSEDMSACAARIAPLLNRMVIFSTTDRSMHGHPEPLACPQGVVRNSIALYYYAAEPAPETRFSRSIRTNYQPRPGERLGVRRIVHQLLLRIASAPKRAACPNPD